MHSGVEFILEIKKNPLSFNGTKKRCALFPPQLDGRKSKVKENK